MMTITDAQKVASKARGKQNRRRTLWGTSRMIASRERSWRPFSASLNFDGHDYARKATIPRLLNHTGTQCRFHLQRDRLPIHNAEDIEHVARIEPCRELASGILGRQFFGGFSKIGIAGKSVT